MKFKFVLLALLFSFNVFATSSPSEIARMMDTGNLKGAEQALREVLQVKDTAKVHYMLAQTYQKMGKFDFAKAELAMADKMDSKHSYTTDVVYSVIADKINGATSKVVSPSPPNKVTANKVTANIGTPEEPFNVPAPTGGLLWFLLFVGVVGGGIGLYYVYKAKLKAVHAKKELVALFDDLKIQVVKLSQDIATKVLAFKTDAEVDITKVRDLGKLEREVLSLYEEIKGYRFLNTYRDADKGKAFSLNYTSAKAKFVSICDRVSSEVKKAVIDTRADTVKATTGKVSSARKVVPPLLDTAKFDPRRTKDTTAGYEQQFGRTKRSNMPEAAQVIHTHETVYINNSHGSNDLVNGVMLGSILNDSRAADRLAEQSLREERQAREARIERREQQERQDRQEREDREAREERESRSYRSSSSSDSGSNDSWGSSSSESSSSSSSSDSGSSDSF